MKGENERLDDMEFDRYGKVKCSKIEQMLLKLMTMVEGEMRRRLINNNNFKELQ